MTNMLEVFRNDNHDLCFIHFDQLPLDAPTCDYVEPKHRHVLSDGKLNACNQVVDPLFPNRVIGEVVRATVVLPHDWFSAQGELNGKKLFVKNPRGIVPPQARTAMAIGAENALVEIDGNLYVAKSVQDIEKFVITRPVVSETEENLLRVYLNTKHQNIF